MRVTAPRIVTTRKASHIKAARTLLSEEIWIHSTDYNSEISSRRATCTI